MGMYKITNITNVVGKRDVNYNSILNIELIENMKKKIIKLKPEDSVVISVLRLPISIHALRIKGLVSVVEVEGVFNKTTPQKNEKKEQTTEKVENNKKSRTIIKNKLD